MIRDIFNQEVNIKKGVIALMILGLVGTTSITGFLLANDNKDIVISKAGDNQDTKGAETSGEKTSDKSDEKPEEEPVDEIKVYVVGEVNRPGVVTLKKGQIIEDAIELAGGPTQDADIENINLVFELEENVMLRIRSKSEKIQQDTAESSSIQAVASGGNAESKSAAKENNSNKSMPAKNVSGSKDKNNSGSAPSENKPGQNGHDEATAGITIIKDSGGAIIGENENSKASSAKININTATLEELDSLPGIGPSTAAKIVSHREQNGDFKAIEDIMNVSGIGQSKFDNIKEFITVK